MSCGSIRVRRWSRPSVAWRAFTRPGWIVSISSGIRAVDDLKPELDDALAVKPPAMCYLEGDNFAYLMSSHSTANFDISCRSGSDSFSAASN